MSQRSSVLISTPGFTESEVFIDEADAKTIYCFFWPEYASKINGLSMSLQARITAQQILVAGVDATYALGYIQILIESLGAGPKGGIKAVLKKLAKKGSKHWFKNATGKNLENPEIAYSVKATIVRNFGTPFREMLEGIAINGGAKQFFAHLNTMPRRIG